MTPEIENNFNLLAEEVDQFIHIITHDELTHKQLKTEINNSFSNGEQEILGPSLDYLTSHYPNGVSKFAYQAIDDIKSAYTNILEEPTA